MQLHRGRSDALFLCNDCKGDKEIEVNLSERLQPHITHKHTAQPPMHSAQSPLYSGALEVWSQAQIPLQRKPELLFGVARSCASSDVRMEVRCRWRENRPSGGLFGDGLFGDGRNFPQCWRSLE